MSPELTRLLQQGLQLPAIANLLHDFVKQEAVQVSNAHLKEDYSWTRGVIGFGFQKQWKKDAAFDVSARYNPCPSTRPILRAIRPLSA